MSITRTTQNSTINMSGASTDINTMNVNVNNVGDIIVIGQVCARNAGGTSNITVNGTTYVVLSTIVNPSSATLKLEAGYFVATSTGLTTIVATINIAGDGPRQQLHAAVYSNVDTTNLPLSFNSTASRSTVEEDFSVSVSSAMASSGIIWGIAAMETTAGSLTTAAGSSITLLGAQSVGNSRLESKSGEIIPDGSTDSMTWNSSIRSTGPVGRVLFAISLRETSAAGAATSTKFRLFMMG